MRFDLEICTASTVSSAMYKCDKVSASTMNMCTALQIPEVTSEWMQTCRELVKSLVQQAPSQAVGGRHLQQTSEPDQQTLQQLF